MADASEEFTYEDRSQLPDILPIFPLPNVVLTPNASLPLFIFEDRYKQMLKDVLEEQKLFGLTFFEPQDDVSTRPPVGTIGCVAEVREDQMLPQTRVLSVAQLLGEAIKRIHRNESVSRLFR